MTTRLSRGVCLLSLSLLAVMLAGCQTSHTGAKLYDGFGNYHWPISTSSSLAQRYFDQGMQMMYGFNHDEAIRSFHEAAAQDPQAAMPWWGIAYAHGININDPVMTDERSRTARAAVDNALARLDGATPVEAAMVRALDRRYARPAPEDRRPLDEAFADAMQRVHNAFPDHPEAATIYADALMNLQPWDYWQDDGSPKGRINDIVAALEGVLRTHPRHPYATHLYIHAVEASADPDRAVGAADRLRTIVPGAGHLVHMPSHIYVRVGRYADAARSNVAAVAADRAYFARAPRPGFYAIYHAHNLHFLAYASMMRGHYADALEAARQLEAFMPDDVLRAHAGFIDGIMPTTLHVMIRFGHWEQVLAEPDYPQYRLVSRAARHYARSIAYSALGHVDEARAELEAFEAAAEAIPDDWYVFNNRIADVMPIARAMIHGELLFREGKHDQAFATLRKGIEAEDALVYDEPPGWMLPVRHALGALLLSAGRADEAEAVYREDLKRNRENGWALLGLQQALAAQGREDDAAALAPRVDRAWADADVMPTSSCYCEPGKVVAR